MTTAMVAEVAIRRDRSMQKSLTRSTVAADFALQWKRIVGLAQVTFASRGSAFSCAYKGSAARGIVLVRSSDFWEYRLHLAQAGAPSLVVCYRHDTCLPVPIIELESGHQYKMHEFPRQFNSFEDAYQSRTRAGRLVIVGGLLCGMQAAYDLLAQLRQDDKESTARKYETNAHHYQKRRPGRQVATIAS